MRYIIYSLPGFSPAQLVQHSSQLILQCLIDSRIALNHHIPTEQPTVDIVLLGQASEFDRRLNLGILFRKATALFLQRLCLSKFFADIFNCSFRPPLFPGCIIRDCGSSFSFIGSKLLCLVS